VKLLNAIEMFLVVGVLAVPVGVSFAVPDKDDWKGENNMVAGWWDGFRSYLGLELQHQAVAAILVVVLAVVLVSVLVALRRMRTVEGHKVDWR
jgi:uncharacterized membrane protein